MITPASLVRVGSILGLAAVAVLALPALAPAYAGSSEAQVHGAPLAAGAGAPMSAADRDMVLKIRLACLWQLPAAGVAMQKAADPRVREIGREIVAQDGTLDQLTRTSAAQLGVALPNRATWQEHGWLDEVMHAKGSEVDRLFVQRLRQEDSSIFPTVATIRADTRNDVVRSLAQTANEALLGQLTMLERTGLVDFGSGIPVPPDPPPVHMTKPAPVQARAVVGGAAPDLIWAVLAIAALAASAALVRVVHPT